MAKIVVRTLLLCVIILTVALSSLSMFTPKELYRDQVAVLMYHHVHDTDTSSSTISTKLFRDQLSYLQSKGYHFISMNEFKQFLDGAQVPENAVLVTFDDGYESFYKFAYPILKEMNVPATNFLITETLNDPQSGNVPFLSREQVQAMAPDKELIDIQCHTNALHDKLNGKALLTNRIPLQNGQEETQEQYDKRIIDDTRACLNSVNAIYPGQADSLAYPFGIYNEEAIKLVTEGGIRYAFTILPKMATRDADHMRIPRINAGSPYITPDALYNMIMRRVTVVKHPQENVPLRETVEQVGGYLTQEEGLVIIYFNGERIVVENGGDKVLREGKLISLDKPMTVSRGRTYVDLEGLQRILGITIYFDDKTQTFTSKAPAASEIDTENMHKGI